MITIQIAEMYPQENVKISITCLINRILTPSMIDMFDHLTYRNTLTFVGPSDAPQFSGRTFRNTNLLKHFEMWPTKQNVRRKKKENNGSHIVTRDLAETATY